MEVRPCAKINLGLNIVSKRPDGYHNLETVFVAVPLYDVLTVESLEQGAAHCELTLEGMPIEGNAENNLVVKAYYILAADYALPPVKVCLRKVVPTQAGMGGGSADGAFMIRLLNHQFGLGLSQKQMEAYAARLGADCPFFITAQAAYATGIGEQLQPIHTLSPKLSGKYLYIVKPAVAISTKEAFSMVVPAQPEVCCKDAVEEPMKEWHKLLHNDFERSAFTLYPSLQQIKNSLYDRGAVYAQMSGSGSALYGLFEEEPVIPQAAFANCFTFKCKL